MTHHPQSYPPPPARPGTGMQTAALILGALGFVTCVTGILAIPVGHVALSEARRRPGREGYGNALAGLILGYLSTAVVVGGIALAAVADSL